MNPLTSKRLLNWSLDMAEQVSKLSKDPSTRVGAVIFDEKRRIVSAGYNGFARGVEDSDTRLTDRDVKYRLTIHAEKNAILFATAPLDGCTLVCTHPCCSQCAALLIQSGIRHVVWPKPTVEFRDRWRDDLALSRAQLDEAGVEVQEVGHGR